MSTKGKALFDLSVLNDASRLMKLGCIVAENNDRALSSLAISSGKEPSLLMNEAVADLIRKYMEKDNMGLLSPQAGGKENHGSDKSAEASHHREEKP